MSSTMQLGVCTSIQNTDALTGWDFIEEHTQNFLSGEKADWPLPAASRVPVRSANCLLPGSLKIVGPVIDLDAIHAYMHRVLERAEAVGITTLVMGSGGARGVPEGFDRETATHQIEQFLSWAALPAARHGITLAIEPLNRRECNILNTIGEVDAMVQRVDHPAIRGLVDSYHFWLEHDSLDDLAAAVPRIAHVHVADEVNRTAPGGSGQSDYSDFFRVLKRGGYAKAIAVECNGFELNAMPQRVLEFLKHAWASA